MASKLICQHCGSPTRQPHGGSSRRWMRAGAALMVALPCALAAGPVSLRSQPISIVLLVTAIVAGTLGLLIALHRPRCPRCGHHTARMLVVPEHQSRITAIRRIRP